MNKELALIGYCSWCYHGLHRTKDPEYEVYTDWCDCGWWDALPERWEY